MESKPAQNIQDTFLNTVRKDKSPITIYLVSGVKLTGKIRSFDKYSVLLENNAQEQLIFKHAISTVVSGRVAPHTDGRVEAKPEARGAGRAGGSAAASAASTKLRASPAIEHSPRWQQGRSTTGSEATRPRGHSVSLVEAQAKAAARGRRSVARRRPKQSSPCWLRWSSRRSGGD